MSTHDNAPTPTDRWAVEMARQVARILTFLCSDGGQVGREIYEHWRATPRWLPGCAPRGVDWWRGDMPQVHDDMLDHIESDIIDSGAHSGYSRGQLFRYCVSWSKAFPYKSGRTFSYAPDPDGDGLALVDANPEATK